MKKEVVSFRKVIAPATTEVLKERIKDNGEIEEIRIRFNTGQERALKVRPYVIHHANRQEDVFTYAETTETHLSGEDDYFIFPVSVSVQYDDQIAVWVSNTDLSFSYTVSVDVVISYFASEVS
jgi:hypothetical protein